MTEQKAKAWIEEVTEDFMEIGYTCTITPQTLLLGRSSLNSLPKKVDASRKDAII